LEEEEKPPSHPWTSSKDIWTRMLVNPLFVAMENNPKLNWGGHARNMCIEYVLHFMKIMSYELTLSVFMNVLHFMKIVCHMSLH
jgi:hypothetical protein